jgi:hypothetical protein
LTLNYSFIIVRENVIKNVNRKKTLEGKMGGYKNADWGNI